MRVLLLVLIFLLPSPAFAGDREMGYREIKLAVHNETRFPLEVYIGKTVFCNHHFGSHYFCGLHAYVRGSEYDIKPDAVIAPKKYFLLDRFFYAPADGKFSVCVKARRPWTKSNAIFHQNLAAVECRLVDIPYQDFHKKLFRRITVKDRKPTLRFYQGKGRGPENYDNFDTYNIKIDDAKLE